MLGTTANIYTYTADVCAPQITHVHVNISDCMLGQKGHYPTSLIDYISHALPARTAYFSPTINYLHLHAEYIKVVMNSNHCICFCNYQNITDHRLVISVMLLSYVISLSWELISKQITFACFNIFTPQD